MLMVPVDAAPEEEMPMSGGGVPRHLKVHLNRVPSDSRGRQETEHHIQGGQLKLQETTLQG